MLAADRRLGAMQDLGGTIGERRHAQHLRSLERRLAGRTQAEPAPDHEAGGSAGQATRPGRPVEGERLRQPFGCGSRHSGKRLVLGESADQHQAGQQGVHDGLGRGDRELGPGCDRDDMAAGPRGGRTRIVDDGDGLRAGSRRLLGGSDQIRAAAGLRDQDVERLAETRARAIARHDRRSGRGRTQAEAGFDQVAQIGAGMAGAAAAADHRMADAAHVERCRDLRDDAPPLVQQAGGGLRNFSDLARHARARAVRKAHDCGPMASPFRVATKS